MFKFSVRIQEPSKCRIHMKRNGYTTLIRLHLIKQRIVMCVCVTGWAYHGCARVWRQSCAAENCCHEDGGLVASRETIICVLL